MRAARELRLVVYDETCVLRGGGLSSVWWLGSELYVRAGWVAGARGVSSWSEAFHWLCNYPGGEPIAQVQFWGHGKWGRALIGDEVFDRHALSPRHELHGGLCALRERLAPTGVAWWFRTCETFGARPGHDFARRFSEFLGAPVAGHTHVIADWQSGLHSLEPGAQPSWSEHEGLRLGTPAEPRAAARSRPWLAHTVSALRSRVPDGW